MVGGGGEGGKMKEGEAEKEEPLPLRPDQIGQSLLFRRRSLPPFAAHIGEENKKQDVKDAALICPRHGDTLTSVSSCTPLGSEALRRSPARAQSGGTGEAQTGSASRSAEETWRPERRRRWRQTQRRTVGGRIVQFCQNLSGRVVLSFPASA